MTWCVYTLCYFAIGDSDSVCYAIRIVVILKFEVSVLVGRSA